MKSSQVSTSTEGGGGTLTYRSTHRLRSSIPTSSPRLSDASVKTGATVEMRAGSGASALISLSVRESPSALQSWDPGRYCTLKSYGYRSTFHCAQLAGGVLTVEHRDQSLVVCDQRELHAI